MTKQKKVLVSKGIKPVLRYQHSYQYLWLCIQNPKELKLLIIDNAGFHACKNIQIPENIILIRIPPYTPELNPAEKIWQWMKDRIAMKFFTSIEDLKQKITLMVNQLNPELIKSITGYQLYTNLFYENF